MDFKFSLSHLGISSPALDCLKSQLKRCKHMDFQPPEKVRYAVTSVWFTSGKCCVLADANTKVTFPKHLLISHDLKMCHEHIYAQC